MHYNNLTQAHFASASAAGALTGPRVRRGAAGALRHGIWVQFDVRLSGHSPVTRAAQASEDARARGDASAPADLQAPGDAQAPATEEAPLLIETVRFLAFGCPHVIAVADWIAQTAPGCPARPALPETVHRLRTRFDVPIEKLGRLLIVEDAWIAALSSPYPGPE